MDKREILELLKELIEKSDLEVWDYNESPNEVVGHGELLSEINKQIKTVQRQ